MPEDRTRTFSPPAPRTGEGLVLSFTSKPPLQQRRPPQLSSEGRGTLGKTLPDLRREVVYDLETFEEAHPEIRSRRPRAKDGNEEPHREIPRLRHLTPLDVDDLMDVFMSTRSLSPDRWRCSVRQCTTVLYDAKPSDVKRHLFTHLYTSCLPFVCDRPDCGFRTAQRTNLNVHSRNHVGEPLYKCDKMIKDENGGTRKCQYSFSCSRHLTRHIQGSDWWSPHYKSTRTVSQ